jgi:multidrug efflux system membrane fusion protein
MIEPDAGRHAGAGVAVSDRADFFVRSTALSVLGVGAVVIGLSACHRAPPPAAAPALVASDVVHHEAGTGGADTLRYPVEVAARYSNVMSFRVSGKLIERTVRLGDAVRKDQVIARLDALDAQKQAASAHAALAAAEHRLLFTTQQLDRDQAQSAQNLIAANQLEQSQDAFAAAAAAREQLAAQLTLALNTLQYNTLVADHDGVITSENADTGQVVTAGQAIYGLAWTGDTDVNLDAAASDLGRIAVGQSASVVFTALSGQRFDARVREISPTADLQSRTYRVRLTLLHAGAAVHLGMTGDAVLAPVSVGAAEPTFKVPATALFHQGKEPALWVIRRADSTLELRPVTVRGYNERFAMVSRGLSDGDRIVVAGAHTVFAGERVDPVAPLFAQETDQGDVPATAVAK